MTASTITKYPMADTLKSIIFKVEGIEIPAGDAR
jgi:hypothetical protein